MKFALRIVKIFLLYHVYNILLQDYRLTRLYTDRSFINPGVDIVFKMVCKLDHYSSIAPSPGLIYIPFNKRNEQSQFKCQCLMLIPGPNVDNHI